MGEIINIYSPSAFAKACKSFDAAVARDGAITSYLICIVHENGEINSACAITPKDTGDIVLNLELAKREIIDNF